MSFPWQDFIKPQRLDTDKKESTNTYGKFVAEPFEKGFGVTIGNSLRRHLISSIQGAAVTGVKFEGVYHEFSTIPGVAEDIADIILNIKELRVKLKGDRPKTIYIKSEGKGVITGKDIITDESVEIVNPEHHIATLDNNGKINAELVVNRGRGYVPSEKNISEDMDTQLIPIDSIFTPVKKSTFHIENTRVGVSTEYERLILEVWTDGSIKPVDAVAQAAKILKEHLQIFINFDEEVEEKPAVVDQKREKILGSLKKSVDELELSVRSYNCLKNANIKTLADLVVKTDSEMLKTQNFGRKSLNEIKEIIVGMGLELGMNIDEYQDELRESVEA